MDDLKGRTGISSSSTSRRTDSDLRHSRHSQPHSCSLTPSLVAVNGCPLPSFSGVWSWPRERS